MVVAKSINENCDTDETADAPPTIYKIILRMVNH